MALLLGLDLVPVLCVLHLLQSLGWRDDLLLLCESLLGVLVGLVLELSGEVGARARAPLYFLILKIGALVTEVLSLGRLVALPWAGSDGSASWSGS